MARGTRSPQATSTGPGRRNRRPRAGARADGAAEESQETGESLPGRLLRRGMGLTRRMLVLAVVLLLLALSFASSLRIYLSQQYDLAVAHDQIRTRTAQIEDLETELERWEDPAYVKAQARLRLGWVMPGETGYRVIGEDGEPLGPGVTITSEQELPAGEHEPVWWDRMWGSVQTADAPTRKVGQ